MTSKLAQDMLQNCKQRYR